MLKHTEKGLTENSAWPTPVKRKILQIMPLVKVEEGQEIMGIDSLVMKLCVDTASLD